MRQAFVRVNNITGDIVEVIYGSDATRVRQRQQRGFTWHEVTGDPNLYLVVGLEERKNWTVSGGTLVRR